MNTIEKLIIASLHELLELSCIKEVNNHTTSKLVFPVKRDGCRRVSEQEARFLFAKHLERDGSFYYSIEAPTNGTYKFTGAGERSGNVDICLYENGKRKHLIEFKAHNPKESFYSKDFEKLFFDEENLDNYFIQIIESSDDDTIPNIEKKYREAIEIAKGKKNQLIQASLIIFLCDLKNKSIHRYKVDKNEKLLKIDSIAYDIVQSSIIV